MTAQDTANETNALRDRLIDPRSPDRRRGARPTPCPRCSPRATCFWVFTRIMEAFKARILNAPANAQASAAATALSRRGDRHRSGRIPRRPGRTHRAHDQHRQRFRPRDGFAGRRDHLRHRSGGAGVRLGRAVRRRSPPAPITLEHLHRAGYFCRVSVSAVRRDAPGALQHPEAIPCRRIPGAPIASISSACRFPAAAGMVASVVYASRQRSLAVVDSLRRRGWRCSACFRS